MNPIPASAPTGGVFPRSLVAALLLSSAVAGWAQEAPVKPVDEAVKPVGDDVVQLEKYTVTTAIDSYHQQTSTMASKIPMELKDLAASLQVMNSAAINDRNAVTLVDVFGYVVGANQSQSNINGFTFRGFPNTGSYTQNIQFDGLMGPTLKKAATSAVNVDSMEFLKGPNGVLYGQMNPGGLLNIVTKNPKEKQETSVRFTAGFYAGEFNDFGSKVTNTFSIDNTGAVPGIKHLYYRMIADVGSAPTSRPGNWARNYSFYPSLTYKWSADTSFTIKMEASQDRRRQDDGIMPIFTSAPVVLTIGGVATTTAAYGEGATFITAPLNTVYNDHADESIDYGQALSTFFHTSIGANWQLRVQSRSVWHVDDVKEFTFNNANVWSPTARYATPTSLIRRQFNHVKNGHRYNYIDANAFRNFTTGPIKHTVIIGSGGGWEFFGNKRLAFGPNQALVNAITLFNPVLDQVPYPPEGTGATDQATNQTAFGQYVSDQMAMGRFHVSAGLRHDHQTVEVIDKVRATVGDTTMDAYTKQLGSVVDLTSQLAAYASFSQSIKPQTNIAYDINGKTGFPAETGEQYEAGLKFENTAKTFNASIAGYEITRTNVVVPTGQNFTVATGSAAVGAAISRLDGEQTSTGVELELRWQPIKNWQIQAGGAYSHARITASEKNPDSVGKDLINAPRKTANFWTRYNFPTGALKGLGTGLGIIHVGEAWAGDPTSAVYFKMPAWTRVDGSLYYKWNRYDLSLNVQNLLDKRYITSAFSAQVLNVGEQRKLTFAVGLRF
jgi:iron complex outermembrane receptor protein